MYVINVKYILNGGEFGFVCHHVAFVLHTTNLYLVHSLSLKYIWICLIMTFRFIFVFRLLFIFGRLSFCIPVYFNGRNKWNFFRWCFHIDLLFCTTHQIGAFLNESSSWPHLAFVPKVFVLKVGIVRFFRKTHSPNAIAYHLEGKMHGIADVDWMASIIWGHSSDSRRILCECHFPPVPASCVSRSFPQSNAEMLLMYNLTTVLSHPARILSLKWLKSKLFC